MVVIRIQYRRSGGQSRFAAQRADPNHADSIAYRAAGSPVADDETQACVLWLLSTVVARQGVREKRG
jgi:hypothetical protein